MYNTTIYLRYAAREETCTTTNPGSSILSKFIGYGSIDADDEAEGLEASTHPPTSTNRSGWTTVLLWKLLVPLRLS